MEGLDDLLGESAAIQAIRDSVRRLIARPQAGRRLPAVLIQGETGTGKGLMARLIHRHGPRATGPFVDVNCAAIPETLLEAELFGFERGAFTDARRAKPGLFQTAHRGAIFFDEVGLLPEALQAKLLKVLEEQAVRRLGSTASEPVDVWIISATNTDLQTAIAERRFREDLYHRLAVLTLQMPPLRDRGRDVLLLANRFLARACADYGLPPKAFSPEAQSRLLAYSWPGNVRELANMIERVALLAEGAVVSADALEIPSAAASAPSPGYAQPSALASLDAAMREHVLATLTQTGWNISRTAALLGISRNTLRARIEKFGLRAGASAPVEVGRPGRTPAAEAPKTATAMVPSAPGVHTSSAIRWESRRLTLLRAALITPEGADELPDTSRALDLLLDKLRSFGGRIEDVSPWAVSAVFGLEPVEDAPRRAAHAAMALQKAAERGRRGDGESFSAKIGIHVAQVLVGQSNVGIDIDADAKRAQWDILDSLLSSAEADSIMLTAAARAFLERRFDLAVETGTAGSVYRLQGRERKGPVVGGKMAWFVGRRQELDLLKSRLASARAGHGQIVGIVGEAGIGKSRLLYEFRQALRGEAITYIEGHCLSYGSAIPYMPVLEILRRACRITVADAPDTVAHNLRMSLKRLGIEPEEALPYLLHFLGIKEGTEALAVSTTERIRDRTFQILRQMCVNASRRRPLIIAIEDLHWIDTASGALATTIESLEGVPLTLIFTYRPGYRSPWIERSHITQIALQPLSGEDSLTVLGGLLPPARLAEPVAQLILSKAEGNPFFLEELARTVQEQGSLSPTLTVPDTVEEVLLARINRLPDRDRQLLQAAAVVGKDVPITLLREIAEMPDDELRSDLGRLQAAELIYEMHDLPDVAYTFKHALTHDVAYESLLHGRRRMLHSRLVEAIERLYGDGLSAELERLAHHSFAGEAWEKAARYAREAAAKVYTRSAAAAEAALLYDRALLALSRLPLTRDRMEEAVDLHLAIRTPLAQLLEHERVLEHLREAERLAAGLADRRRLGRVYTFMTAVHYETAAYEEARRYGARALELVTGEGDWEIEFVVRYFLAQIALWSGDHREALNLYGQAIALDAAHEGSPRSGVFVNRLPVVVAWTAICLAELGRFTEAVAQADRALRLAEDEPFNRVVAHLGVGRVHLERGDLATAVTALEQAFQLCHRTNNLLYLVQVIAALGYARALWGAPAEGLALLETAVSRAHARRQAVVASTLAWQGETLFLAGRPDEARAAAERACALARERGERCHEARALHLLGKLAFDREPADLDDAERHFRQGLAFAEALSMRPLLAHCHLGLGRLCRRVEKPPEAEEHLITASTMYREMDMRFWMAQAEAALEPRG